MKIVAEALSELKEPFYRLTGCFSVPELTEKVEALALLVEQSATRIAVRPEPELIAAIYGHLDITSLDSLDNDSKISAFVCQFLQQKAIASRPAAICVFPVFVEAVKQLLNNTGIKLAVVESAFPHGQSLLKSRIEDLKNIIALGADEIDAVIRRGLVLGVESEKLEHEISSLKSACGDKKLKIILNTQELPELNANRLNDIYKLSKLAIRAKADMLKSSTGKEGINANLQDCIAMCRAIVDSDLKVGFKAAGGIKTLQSAVSYYLLAKLTYNENLSSDNFRIGASSLATVLQQAYLDPLSVISSDVGVY